MYVAALRAANLLRFLLGGRRTAVFAITPSCNCRCVMCGMWAKPRQHISLSDAEDVVDFLAERRFLILYLTGGEPTLHPHLSEIVEYASDKGLITTMTTNGTAPTRTLRRLKESGLQSVSISLDHYSPEVCEGIRRFRDINPRQVKSLHEAKSLGLRPYALTYLGPEIVNDGVERLITYVNSLGLPWGFCYPTQARNSFTLKPQEQADQSLLKALYTILYLKMSKKGSVTNTLAYIGDAIRYTRGEPTRYRCRAGDTVVYIDWQGDVYPCFMREKMFNMFEDKEVFKRFDCDLCLANCFREPSYLSSLTLSFALKEVLT